MQTLQQKKITTEQGSNNKTDITTVPVFNQTKTKTKS